MATIDEERRAIREEIAQAGTLEELRAIENGIRARLSGDDSVTTRVIGGLLNVIATRRLDIEKAADR